MAYAVELSDDASATLDTFPVDIAICVNKQLERLADDPVNLGRPAHFPYRPVGQIYQFWCEEDEDYQYYITVFFHYLPGEDTIKVFAIGFARYARGG